MTPDSPKPLEGASDKVTMDDLERELPRASAPDSDAERAHKAWIAGQMDELIRSGLLEDLGGAIVEVNPEAKVAFLAGYKAALDDAPAVLRAAADLIGGWTTDWHMRVEADRLEQSKATADPHGSKTQGVPADPHGKENDD